MCSYPSGRQTFGKPERLVNKRAFETLFNGGKSHHEFPFRLVWSSIALPVDVPAQAAFSVSKRNFKRAVERNRIKRLMKEAYRKNKNLIYPLLQQSGTQAALLFIYTGKTLPDYNDVLVKITLILQRFAKDIQQPVR